VHNTHPSGEIQLRQPRLAEMVADNLRARILSGALADGAMLPKQEDLLKEFRVSAPAIREALSILTTEGLLTVLRGNVGGAIVHRPQPTKAAYMLALVLQSNSVPLSDVLRTLHQFEPACAGACAARDDRSTTVLPKLRATIDSAQEAIDDGYAYTGLARQFHVDIVTTCGIETMSLVVGALESLWSAHVDRLARDTNQLGSFANKEVRLATAKDHEVIYRLIEKGNAVGAEQAAREHFVDPLDHDPRGWDHSFDFNQVIDATTLRSI
jgi:GntR family transcriptional repressor for pyruvate dehydrogenase complex